MEADWTTLARSLGFSEDLSGEQASIPKEVVTFLYSHYAKYIELQKTQSESIVRAAQAEQQSRRLDEQLASSEAKILALKTELESLGNIHEKASSELKQLQSERGQLFGALEEARLNEERLKNRLMSVESEKTELARSVDRKIAEKSALEADHERLLSLLTKLRRDTSELEERVVESQRERSKVSFELSRAHGEIEQLKEKASWSESELDRVLGEIADYRRKKSQEITDLNAVIAEKTEELEQSTIRVQQLAKSNAELNSAVHEYSEELSSLKGEFIRAKADFEAEMESKTRLAELYKSSSEEAERHVKDLEESLENAVNRIKELEATSQHDKEMDSRRKHVADVFAENSQTRLELSRLKQENEKLKECLEEVCGEIEARAPLLNQERKENERLKRELLALTAQVVELGRDRDELSSSQSQSWLEIGRLRRENHSLMAQSHDLCKQVRTLSEQLETEAGGSSPSAFADAIDEDAVVFRSIGELQAKNADLIRRVHELEYMVNQSQSNSVDRHQLEVALREIEDLNQARNRQSAMLESLLKQQSSNTLSHRISSSSLLDSSVNKEVESLRAEKVRIEQTLRDQIQTLLSTEGDLRAKLSMASSQAQYANESLEMMKRSLEAERAELTQLRNRCRELADINMKLNAQVQSASSDAMSAKEREHQATVACNRALSELQTQKAVEERITKELVDLRSERDRYVRLISQLQASIGDTETNYKDMRDRLSQQIELLEKELSSVRQGLTAELEDTRNSYLTVERERRELMSKQEQLLDQLTAAKSDLIRLQAEGGTSAILNSADQSVEHYKAAAKASEQALAELGQAFEEYRMRVESEGFSQSEHLAKELDLARSQLTEQQLRYQLEVAEYKTRLVTLEQLEQQLREHGNMRLEDLANLQNDLARAKEELTIERQQSSDYQAELSRLSERLEQHLNNESALKNQITDLESRAVNFELEKTNLVQEQINIQQRFDELSKQYDALLEKLEGSLKPSYLFPSTISTEDDQIQQIIRYLRREKDVLEEEKTALETENRRLTGLYDKISTSYNQLKRSLTASSSEGVSESTNRVSNEISELRQKLEQMSGYRETAAVLQSQVESLTERLTETESELRAANAKLSPLKEANRELKASVAAHEHEVKILTDDRDLWKRRCQDSNGGFSTDIDPEMVEKLRTDLDQVQQEKDQLTIEANQKLANLEARYAKAVERFNFYKKRCEELQAKISELEVALQQRPKQDDQQQVPSEQMADIANDLEETRGLLNEALAQKDELQSKLEQSEQKSSRLTALLQKHKILKREYDTLKTECEAGMLKAKEEVAMLESKFADLTKEQSLHQNALISQWKSRFEKLQTLLEEYKSRFGDMQTASIVPQEPLKRSPSEYESTQPEKIVRVEEPSADESSNASYNEDEYDEEDQSEENDAEDDLDEEEDDQDYEEQQEAFSDDPMMTDDDLVPVFPTAAEPIIQNLAPTQPSKKVDLFENMKALSPSNEDSKPRPRCTSDLY